MKKQPKGLIRFQSIDERSFNIHKLPLVCGSEPSETWPSLRQETEQDNLANGHAVITTCEEEFLKGLEWRLAFTKDTSVVAKYHFIVSEKDGKITIEPLKPIMVNR